MKIMMKVSTASGEPIRASEKAYFFFHSELKKALQKSGGSSPLDSIPNFRAIPGIWQRALYQTYKIARDWDEEAPASFPVAIEQYVFGLVQRWPEPRFHHGDAIETGGLAGGMVGRRPANPGSVVLHLGWSS